MGDSQRQDSNGCLHHEYIGLPAVSIKYECSLCAGTFDVTAHKIPPHYDGNHGTWHPPVNHPDIKGWSSMNAGEKQAAARTAGCPYCLAHNSSRSCPAHGWKEKRNPENRKTAADFKRDGREGTPQSEATEPNLCVHCKESGGLPLSRLEGTSRVPISLHAQCVEPYVLTGESVFIGKKCPSLPTTWAVDIVCLSGHTKVIRTARHAPQKPSEATENLGPQLNQFIGNGKHRRVYSCLSNAGQVAVKLCIKQKDIRHAVNEISAINAAKNHETLKKYIPEIIFHDAETGMTVMPEYSKIRTPKSAISQLKADLIAAGFMYRYMHGGQIRYESGQLKLIDWGDVAEANEPNAHKNIEPHGEKWNPWVGCRKTSEACKNCIMFLEQGKRYKNFGLQPIHDPANIRRTAPERWRMPYKLQKQAVATGKNVICMICSYSDFFIEEADAWRPDAWKVIRETPNVIYQIQTKRTERITDHLPADWGNGYPNVWLGAPVEMKKYFFRLDHLRAIPCVLRYVDSLGMLEDLCPELEDQLEGIGWCLASGETGCGVTDPRHWSPEWAIHVRDVCVQKNIPFWFSHVAGRNRAGLLSRLLDGRTHDEIPSFAGCGIQ
jgi:protein gp37